MQFQSFGKIPRINRNMVITEKIDGTNGQIVITHPDLCEPGEEFLVGSRNRWITPEADNHGFARWAYEHKEQLIELLGIGKHFGEWWGQGIQRRYDMDKKVFSLFNTNRWDKMDELEGTLRCVPILAQYLFHTPMIAEILHQLKETGSKAAPGFMDPEGIVIYHSAANTLFKLPFEDKGKTHGN